MNKVHQTATTCSRTILEGLVRLRDHIKEKPYSIQRVLIKESIQQTLDELTNQGRISKTHIDDSNVINLYESWTKLEKFKWFLANNLFPFVGSHMREAVESYNEGVEMALDEFGEDWDDSKPLFKNYPQWAILHPEKTCIAALMIKPVQSLDFIQLDFTLNDDFIVSGIEE